MPRKTDNSYAGTFPLKEGGISGGGYAGKRSLADDGTELITTDLGGMAVFRKPNDTRHTQLLRYGINVPTSEAPFGANAQWVYAVAVCATNSNVFAFTRYGRIYRSLDQGATVTKLTGYNSGNTDTTWTHFGHHDMRTSGRHFEFDPLNADRILMGHPQTGAYLSSNFTSTTPTITLVASIPAPTFGADNRYGVQFAFDRSTASGGNTQTVYAFSNGNGFYRSTTGATGTFSAIAGPTTCTDMRAGGGVLWVCDASENLWKWNGTTWAQQFRSGGSEPVKGKTIGMKQGDPLSFFVCRPGGDITHTTDGGTNWTFTSLVFAVEAGTTDQKWIGNSNIGFMSAGMAEWESRSGVNRWTMTTGMGKFYFDNPPRTSDAVKWKSQNDGLFQLLCKGGRFLDQGDALFYFEDRAFFHFERNKLTESPTDHGPSYAVSISHGNDVEPLETDNNFVLGTCYLGHPLWKSNNRGKPGSWSQVTVPGGLAGGNCVPFSTTNYVWVPTDRALPRVTTDGGANWTTPTFRHTEGGVAVDMTGAEFHVTYTMRRKILVKVPGAANTALLFCWGVPPASGVADARTQGVWKTTDGGLNFIRISATRINPGENNTDAFAARMMPVGSAYPNCFFWTIGNSEGPAAPAEIGGVQPSEAPPKFSSDGGVTWTALAGFKETHGLGIGPSDKLANGTPTNAFGWILCAGFRGTQRGIWLCKDFNPANIAVATWEMVEDYPLGRNDQYVGVVADKTTPGRFVLIPEAGGFIVREYTFQARAV